MHRAATVYACSLSLLERITVDPDVVHGRLVVRGTRIRVTDVLSLLAAGAPEEEIIEDDPLLTQEDIKSYLEYAAGQADHAVLTASPSTTRGIAKFGATPWSTRLCLSRRTRTSLT
ncbi:DUF433 domain-containing protein [Arthrobacter castelli]|uniref:DUF433 domain-containing protein n=1 Tax=Arthrobacter castelli TaxID=271431 RepID=UPI003CCC19F2